MARNSQDREDLLRDATAFVNRVQLKVDSNRGSAVVFAGFRSAGAVSIYFDQDPVYHFNNSGELRRAYVEDSLIKAEQGLLIAMRREREAYEVAMLRHIMPHDEQFTFCQRVKKQLGELRGAILNGDTVIEGQVSDGRNENVVGRLVEFLQQLGEITIAASPRVAG